MRQSFLLLAFLTLVSSVVSVVAAQDSPVIDASRAVYLRSETDKEQPKFRHVTLELLTSDEGRAALDEFTRRKQTGQIPYAAKGDPVDIGETKVFTVRNLDSQAGAWDPIEFTKKAEEALFNIWVETAELALGRVTDQDVEEMRLAFNSETRPLSYNPQQGILKNNQDIFGPPPDVDGDGILDVLVMDIRDGWDPAVEGAFTLGFYDPVNLTGQNLADIIHLDSYPGITDQKNVKFRFGRPEQVLAHEYQHLIYSNVNKGVDIPFTNEGLSTWAEMQNGYFPPITRYPDYLDFEDEWTRPLLSWRQGGGPLLEDYQRGGLFTSYLADRIGVVNTGAIAQSVFFGASAYQAVLNAQGLELKDVVAEYHVANVMNDRSLGEAYGHASPMFQSLQVPFVPIVDGTLSNSTAKITKGIGQGGSQYMIWENVADFALILSEENARPNLIRPIVVLEREIGLPEIQLVDMGVEGAFFEGSYVRITLIIPHVDILDWDPTAVPQDATPPRALVAFSAEWQDFQSLVQVVEIVYDTGNVAQLIINGESFDAVQLIESSMKANRFEVPAGGILNSVLIDQPYATDFGGVALPPDSPRDYELVIWDESQDGLPGNELFSKAVTDLSLTGDQAFIFHTTDLSAEAEQMSALPPVIFIGVRNTGSDENYFYMTVSDYVANGSPSYIFDDALGGWAAFDGQCISSCDDIALVNYVHPIRARFVIDSGPTATDDDFEIPIGIGLEQNYPNPFNPVTSIRFSLPNATHVSLRVFDLLGREVDTLVDELLSSGQHEVQFDASSLASGIYIYKLESESESLTRTMTLLK
ncbi:MAG: hypothetical protein BMS9Abin05_1405 [Rhodothermia bacterium]|nr:MAG: hypothetical protein BMS9Abin05_1405 [Rhodothermia bacterium]